MIAHALMILCHSLFEVVIDDIFERANMDDYEIDKNDVRKKQLQ